MSRLPCSSASVCARAAVARGADEIGAVPHEQLDHRHVPASRRDVQRRLAVVAPREIRVGAVFEQPARAGGIGGPTHHVDAAAERRRECRSR